jgi:catechol 2,3-dioxygenase-like lactoylglutathione lyase family enzyme
MATVRYIVNDVGESIEFYTKKLGFEAGEQCGSAFAMVKRGDLTLWLAGPESSAARPMPDGRKPEPGGWSRLVIEAADLAGLVDQLKAAGVKFRNDIVKGPGGQQTLLEDPSGNVVELFQTAE